MISRSVVLLVFWVAIWGELSVANVVSGVVAVSLVTWLFIHRGGPEYGLRPWGALVAVATVGWSLVTSSARVVLAVLAPTPARTSTSIQTVRLEGGSVFVASVVANAITLTPGTMSLDLDRQTLELSVHVLGNVETNAFRRDVLSLERTIARAVRERGVR